MSPEIRTLPEQVIRQIPLDQIEPDPNQPRKTYSQELLAGLAVTTELYAPFGAC